MTFYTQGSTLPERPAFDFYQTEISLIDTIINKFIIDNNININNPPFKYVLDTGCGTGRWGAVLKKYFPNILLKGVDVDWELHHNSPFLQYYDVIDWSDYLSWQESSTQFDLIIGNPPFKLKKNGKGIDAATEFVVQSEKHLKQGGHLLYLLRLNFQTSIKRYHLFKRFPLTCKYPCMRRPRFRDKGTNIHDYAVFHWVKGSGNSEEYITRNLLHERDKKDSEECLRTEINSNLLRMQGNVRDTVVLP